ncbi:hypothetical protein DB347_01060 [Opitutaceae bacterium EW11]|nr:hypothetical protein DB347_01060 [Opitutaceae bacterium EW11]
MEWLFDHVQILIAIAAAVAIWLKQRRAADGGDSQTPPPVKRRQAPTQINTDSVDERVRRIQEEIRRKVQARTGGMPVPPPLPSVQPSRPAVPDEMPRAGTQSVPPPIPLAKRGRAEVPTATIMAEAKESREWAEELRRAEERRRETRRLSKLAEERPEAAPTRDQAATPANLVTSLRDPASVRRAVLLREILGTPVGLR